MKSIFQIAAVAVCATAEPLYGYGGYGYGQYAWPSSYGYGYERTCWGCRRGKRSAEAEPEPYYGYGGTAYHPYGGRSWVGRTIWGLNGGYGYGGYRGKRSAEPEPYYGYGGTAYHPYGGRSYVGRTIWGFPSYYRGKRSAEPEPARFGGYGYYPSKLPLKSVVFR